MSHLFITGASSGIGAETARRAAGQGYSLSLMARASGRDAAAALADQIKAEGGRAVVVPGDVTGEADIVAAFDAATQANGAITAVLNSAGISTPAPIAELDFEVVARTMAINVTGLMICCREAARLMSTKTGGKGGSIVNISSMAATIGGRPGASVYAASKGAVDVFTTGIARELADQGVRVNAIRPGVIATRMTANLEDDPALKDAVAASIPMGRIGEAREIADIVLWLFSDAASFVTGAHINAGGGGFHVAAATKEKA